MWSFDIVYIIINLILIVIFIFSGIKVSKGANPKPYILLCTFMFMLVLGSRYMRGNDYIRYQETFLKDDDADEVLFTFLNQFLRGIGFTKYTFLYVYSIPFAYCGLSFVSKFNKYAAWMFPTFLIAFILFDEYCIRQALSFSFLFPFLFHLLNLYESKHKLRDIFICLMFAIIASSIHIVNALIIVILLIIYLLSFNLISWKISIPIYLFVAFVASKTIDWDLFSNTLVALGTVSPKLGKFVARSNQFFSEDAFQEDWSRSFAGQIFEALGHCCLIYLGYKVFAIKWRLRKYYTLYNIYVVGSVMDRLFWNFELLRRVFDPILAFWCFVFSFVVVDWKKIKLNTIEITMIMGLTYFIYERGVKYLFQRGEMTLFLWDV